ncbi:TPA: hypothetical protein NR353_003276 [Legionella pneumophila]|uniref:LidE n=1 Tax=Legionella waltersii TaxID=66969 RepID=A0A0W1AGE7_9GAMM|nr:MULTISPECIES: hypothetical protein [Legionella]KTD80396.1 LidE [Legionella waltersii]SNV10198.1 LidE [Legionella waltersii]HAT1919909.1 hypothetical protein [Legionella pneumophila]HAT6367488.1 hypothetical protein [Legionella pneumophila]HAT6380484.1 hypothetical protein [Legionella pneumophila]
MLNEYNFLDTKVGCAYAFLADKRAEIARTLEHAKQEKRTKWYGAIRPQDFESIEMIYSDDVTAWEQQKDKIFENCHNLVKKALQANLPEYQEVDFEDYSILHRRFVECYGTTEFEGCIRLMSELPQNFKEYKESYIFLSNNGTKKLYYITPEGIDKEVVIDDLVQFEQDLNDLNKEKKNVLRLSGNQIKTLITKNTGHIPDFNFKERVSDEYTIKIKSPEKSKTVKFQGKEQDHSVYLSTIMLSDRKDGWYVIALGRPPKNTRIQMGMLYLYKDEENMVLEFKNEFGENSKIIIKNEEFGEHLKSIEDCLSENKDLTKDDQNHVFKVAEKHGYVRNKSVIELSYPLVNKDKIKGDLLLADKYYSEMEHACDEKSVQTFLENAGRLSHLLAHVLPVKLGNASCVELLIKGLAESKGLDLGPFSYKEKIGWDWKALTTASREEYASWYAQNAFSNSSSLEFGSVASHQNQFGN